MTRGAPGTLPLEMARWFNTSYHYLVPELDPDLVPRRAWGKPVDELREALALGHQTRPVLLGPVSFLLLSRPAATAGPVFDTLTMLAPLLAAYRGLLVELAEAGAEWVQLDEPSVARHPTPQQVEAVAMAYDFLGAADPRPKLCVATYYGTAPEVLPALLTSHVEGIGLDLSRGWEATLAELERLGGMAGRRLVAGVVDGRSAWAADLEAALTVLERARDLAGELATGLEHGRDAVAECRRARGGRRAAGVAGHAR